MDLTVNTATLSGYDDSQGRPDEGKNLLTVEVSRQVTMFSSGGNSGYSTYSADFSTSTIDRGVTPTSSTPSGGGNYTLLFAVPTGTKQFTVTYNAAIATSAAWLPDLSFSFTGQCAAIALP